MKEITSKEIKAMLQFRIASYRQCAAHLFVESQKYTDETAAAVKENGRHMRRTAIVYQEVIDLIKEMEDNDNN